MDDALSRRVLESGYGVNELIEIGLTVTRMCKNKSNPESVDLLSELQIIKQMMGAPAKRGALAENSIIATLVKSFPEYDIENVTHRAGMCDVLISDETVRIAVEVKNYEENVPSSQVKKFERDLISMDVTAAIMISCKSGIASAHGQFTYKMIANKLAVFLANGGNDGISIVWAVLFIKASSNMIRKLANESGQSVSLVLAYVESKLETVRDCIVDNHSAREALTRMKANMMRAMDNSVEDIVHILNLNKSRLQGLVESFAEFLSTDKVPVSIGIAVEAKEEKKQTLTELRKKAKELGIETKGLKKQELIEQIGII